MKQYIFLAVWTLSTLSVNAQWSPAQIDSLQRLLSVRKLDTNRVNLLLQLSQCYVLKPGEDAHDLDTALRMSQQATALAQSLHDQTCLGEAAYTSFLIWLEKGDFSKASLYAEQAGEFFRRHKQWDQLGYVYMNQARFYTLEGDELPKKIHFYEKALACFIQANDKVKQADMYKELSDLHQIQENYALALTELQSALRLFRAIGHTDLATVYDLLGFVSAKLGDYKEGLAFGLMAVRAAEANKDSSLTLCTIYNRVGLTYYGMGQFKQAEVYFQKSLAIALKHKNNAYILHLVGNLSDLLVQQHKSEQALRFLREKSRQYPPTTAESQLLVDFRFVTIYTALNRFKLAQTYCNQALGLLAKGGIGSLGHARIYQAVINFFIKSGQFQQARQYLALNESRCQLNGSIMALAKNHLQWFKLDSTQTSYFSAIRHYQRYKGLQDSLLNTTKSRQIAQLEIEFESEKKDQNLKLSQQNIQFLTKQSHLQQNQLQQAHTIRNGTIVGIIMLILLLGLSYNRYHLKQRSNQLLEAKQLEINQKNRSLQKAVDDQEHLLREREWMLREIHHRVKNNLQIITSLLHSQSTYLTDQAALAAIRESQNRVHAMALIHQKLYQSNRLSSIPMAEYINEIVEYLMGTFDLKGNIKKQIAVTPVDLDVTLAVPLGLIINEAITNSLKYAFPMDRSGTIQIELNQVDDHNFWLLIGDDGIGLPTDLNPSRSRTLGMSLIRGLSKQLGGKLQINQMNGVQISLLFAEDKVGQSALVSA
ncbi:tetratricopeptide repeat protein [Spirosoma sp. KCTC 42546]|uniref:tetratricopeptide repeat-containing sensor histidine kinase n=1 Tax=Spirosoma sp. KCTC 42546 TaxID=2520506 RepID=UPI001157EB4F|nr:histidine kinase dimerization/phosphoacceptor domain -containing protein [Spirosoma sp. KCTC 42546]QDK81896.1 tetratricopeptide repeat protein [Spirosoma sp. KCTC 42546]